MLGLGIRKKIKALLRSMMGRPERTAPAAPPTVAPKPPTVATGASPVAPKPTATAPTVATGASPVAPKPARGNDALVALRASLAPVSLDLKGNTLTIEGAASDSARASIRAAAERALRADHNDPSLTLTLA